MHDKSTQMSQGIVLIEAIVAISVFILFVVGSFGSLVQATKGIYSVSDNMVATYLAQDVIEWVVAKEAHNGNTGKDFLHELSISCGSGCDINTAESVSAGKLDVCSDVACLLYLNDTSGVYSHNDSDEKTYYTRKVVVSPIDYGGAAEEALVTVTVSWPEGSRTDSVSLTYNIYAS